MKIILTISGLIGLLAACSQSDNHEANVALVAQYLEAVDNNDYALMESLLADDYLGLGPSIDDSTNKEMAIANWRWNNDSLYQDVKYERTQTFGATIKEGPNAGDWAYNWAHVTITYKDGSGPVELLMNAVYKIENGKIARTRTFYNEADVWEQLGYRLFPPLYMMETEDL